MMKLPILVFSHLRWDFVYQRPQHLMSRLKRNRRIIFFEEPFYTEEPAAFLRREAPLENVLVLKPHTPLKVPGFHDEQLPYLKPLLHELLRDEAIFAAIAWFYTPMALPLIQEINPAAIVYDCMDELSAFLNAPRQLLQRETALLKAADVVFTGGPSLYRAKRDRHANVHCFASSVDAAHFAPSVQRVGERAARLRESALQADLPRPRLGFFGVIDERIDLGLIAAMAKAHPEWQIVMVGPVAKIDRASLPRNSNIHYFGQQDYGDLPGFIDGWDACLLPFALNQATRFISPTKTLEYMAAEKPIVSTPIADVAGPYAGIVYLGATHGEFIAACEQALVSAPDERARRLESMRSVLAKTSWDATAEAMAELLERVPMRGPAAAEALLGRAAPLSRSALPIISGPHEVVIGAGPTGLSAAYHLGANSLLLEQNATVGGWCRSIEDHGFTFDYAGHIMFSNDPYVHRLYKVLLGENVHWQDREAWVYSKNVYTRYPFQGSLYGLPPEVAKECIIGAIEARFGRIAPARKSLAKIQTTDAGACKAESLSDCCGDGVLESSARLNSETLPFPDRRQAPRNFEEFIYRVWGAGIAKHFAIPYNKKLWAVPLSEMETSWLGGRVPLPDLGEMIEGALKPVGRPMGPNARFGYPLRGGFQAMMNGFLPHLKGKLKLNAKVIAVSPSRHSLTLADGGQERYSALISTIPLPRLIQLIGDEAPRAVQGAANSLRHVSVRCVNLGIGRENITDKHWIYYPEATVFHRIFVQGNASPHCNPSGGFGLTCEITYSEYKPLPCDGQGLVDRCVRDCVEVGILRADDAVWTVNQVDMPFAYVVYDHARAANVRLIRDWLIEHDIVLAGRYSEWEYYNSDHAFLAGKKAADAVRSQQGVSRLTTA